MKRLLVCAVMAAAAIGMLTWPASAHTRLPSVSRLTASVMASAGCVVPPFVPEVTDYVAFQHQAQANGCLISFNGRVGTVPARTIHGVGAYAGPADADGLYPPAQYVGSVRPGQVLPAGSLLVASVNGVKFFRPHW